MPVKKIIKHDFNTQIVVWELIESKEFLINSLNLEPKTVEKLADFSVKKTIEFLGKVACLNALQINDEVLYKPNGKPFFKNTKLKITISHSNQYICLAVSDVEIGVDIEQSSLTKIKNVSKKFVNDFEQLWLSKTENKLEQQQIIWGIKESLYKITEGKYWNFLNHYFVNEFEIKENFPIKCFIKDEEEKTLYNAFYEKIEDFCLVWVIKS